MHNLLPGPLRKSTNLKELLQRNLSTDLISTSIQVSMSEDANLPSDVNVERKQHMPTSEKMSERLLGRKNHNGRVNRT